jgi:hypothetical protein
VVMTTSGAKLIYAAAVALSAWAAVSMCKTSPAKP